MIPQERAVLEALMVGEEPSGWRFERPPWMADGACQEHPEVEFVPLNPCTEANADEARSYLCRLCLPG